MPVWFQGTALKRRTLSFMFVCFKVTNKFLTREYRPGWEI